MTREEAINILWMYDVNFEPHPAEEVMHAIDMAIEALRQPEIVRCKDCKYFEYDHPCMIQGVPVLGHLVCIKWGNGCRTDEDGFCFMGERKDG